MPNPDLSITSDLHLIVELKRGGKIKGESKDKVYPGEIQLISWSLGASSLSAPDSLEAAARRNWSPLRVTKLIDKASTPLVNALITNAEIKDLRVVCRKSGQDPLPYYEIHLRGARVESIEQAVQANAQAIEQVSFVYAFIELLYSDQTAGGGKGGQSSVEDTILLGE